MAARSAAVGACVPSSGVVAARERALFEGFVVALDRLLGAGDLGADRGEALFECRSLSFCFRFGFGDRLLDEGAVAVDAGELLEDRVFEFVLGEAFAAAGFWSVLLPSGAGVVVVGAAVAARGHADVGAAAAAAAHEAGEEEIGGVAATAREILASFSEDRLCAGEGELVDDRFVLGVEGFVAPADLAGVGGVGEDEVHRRMPPAGRGCWRLFGAELFCNRDRAEPLARVELEDALHDGRLDRIGDEQALFVGEDVAEGRSAAEPASLFCASFDAGADPVDDRGVFELGEHTEHLQHHPPRGRAGVERLGRRAQHHVVGVEFLGELGELAHLA